jgi:hypothetical protein
MGEKIQIHEVTHHRGTHQADRKCETKPEIHNRSRTEKWILSRRTTGIRQVIKTDISIAI